MRARVISLVVLGAVLLGALAWLTLRSGAPSQPLARGPERSAETSGPDVAQPDKLSSEATTDPVVAVSSTEMRRAQLPARETARPRTIVLYGYVRAAEGMPPLTEPAYVAVVDAKGERVQAEASAEGAYSISGLPPGKYHLTAGARPNSTAEASLDLELTETPKKYDITLIAKSSLLVRVADRSGQPLKKTWLGAVATREAPGDWVEETPNQDLFGVGRFNPSAQEGSPMPEGCIGRLDLEVVPPVFVSLLHNQRVIATQRVEAGQQEVAFVVDATSPALATSTVRIRFVDQAGAEVPKLWATLNGGSSTRMAKPEAGAFVWSGLAPGWYRVQVVAPGLEQPTIECRVEPGEDKDFGTVTLAPEQWISGRIVEPQKTAARIDLRCDPYDPDAGRDVSLHRYKSIMTYGTEPDRTFRIAGRSRGLYLMKCDERESSYGIWARLVDTRSGPVENVAVELVRGVPVLVHPSGNDWHAVRFTISDEAGVPYVSSQLWGVDPSRILLAPGRYQVEVRVGASEPTHKTITVAADQVDLPLP